MWAATIGFARQTGVLPARQTMLPDARLGSSMNAAVRKCRRSITQNTEKGKGRQRRRVTIGDVSLQLAACSPTCTASRVPVYYGFHDVAGKEHLQQLAVAEGIANNWYPKQDLQNARWMLQKYGLGQDMFLMGAPGPYRRQLAMWFAELAGTSATFLRLFCESDFQPLPAQRRTYTDVNSTHDTCTLSYRAVTWLPIPIPIPIPMMPDFRC